MMPRDRARLLSTLALLFYFLVFVGVSAWVLGARPPTPAWGQSEVFVCTLPTGQVVVISPAPRYVADLMARGLSRAQALDAIRQKDAPASALCDPVSDRNQLPSRRFRNAWQKVGEHVQVNLPAARQIRRQEIERDLDRKIEKSLKEEVLVVDRGGSPAAHKAYRATLRTLKQTLRADLDALTTPAALEAWQPSIPADP